MRILKNYIKYLWKATEGFHRQTALRVLLGILRVGFILVFIWLSKTAVDCATGRTPASDSTLIMWFGLMILAMLSEVMLSQWVRYIEARSIMQLNNRLNRRFFNTLMDMPFVQGRQGFHSGDMINRMTLDVRTLSNFALSQLPSLFVLLFQLLGAFLFLSFLNPWLALAPVIIMPVCMIASKLYFRRQRRLVAEIRQGESDMQISIQEGLKHRMVLKTLQCVPVIDSRIGDIQQNLDSTNREQTRLSNLSGGLVRLGFVLGYLVAFGWSIFSLRAGLITFGTMTAFIQLVNRIQHPIAGISSYIPWFIKTSVAIDRLREIDTLPRSDASPSGPEAASAEPVGEAGLSTVPNPEPNPEPAPRSGENLGIRISGLSFRYEPDTDNIYSGFSHDFPPGSRTLIVGATGAGKTTLIKLLLGLLKPDAGSIEIYNEHQSRPVSASTISNFVYVPQGNSLLPGSIRENLRLAAPDATDSRIAEALHIAVADFVYALPLGLDTPCDEAGGGLSEGQAQRIAIARALLRPGSIMLLDEFNSALDVETAETLMRRLSESRPDSTIIIIAHHRTAIAPYCDTILPIHK